MIDLESEQLRLLADASNIVPGNPHVSTLIRWWRRGVRGVKLETIVVGGRRFTSVEAIHRFVALLSEPRSLANLPSSPKRLLKASIVARKLDSEGIR